MSTGCECSVFAGFQCGECGCVGLECNVRGGCGCGGLECSGFWGLGVEDVNVVYVKGVE